MKALSSLLIAITALWVPLAIGCSESKGSNPGVNDAGSNGAGDAGNNTGTSTASCGDGVVNVGEECEGLTGCADTKRCTHRCVCEDLPHVPVESGTLITRALADGKIDKPTSLLYRAWSFYGDSRLPSEYDGEITAAEDDALFDEIETTIPTLPPDQAAMLTPFVVRPTDSRSYFNAHVTPGAAPNRSRSQSLADPDPSIDDCPLVPGTDHHDWRYTETPHFVVWSCGYNSAIDDFAPKRQVMASLAEQVSNLMTPTLGPFKGDDDTYGPAPTDRIDMYLLSIAQCRYRQGQCVGIPRPDVLARAQSSTPCSTSDLGSFTTSGYVLVPIQAVPASATGHPLDMRYTLAHEFYHLFQYSRNAGGVGAVCRPPYGQLRHTSTNWLLESTAEWGSWVFVPEDGARRRTAALAGFQQGRSSVVVGLQTLEPKQFPYQAFLYHTFVQQESGADPTSGFRLWNDSVGANTPDDLERLFNSQFSYADHFRDFAVRNLNPARGAMSPGEPIQPAYEDLDSALVRGQLPDIVLDLTMTPRMKLDLPVKIHPLAAHYESHEVRPETRYAKLDFGGVSGAEPPDIDVIKKVKGQWSREKLSGSVFEFCRDNADEDVEQYLLVISNHSWSAGGDVSGNYHLQSEDHCPERWSGSMEKICTDDEVTSVTEPALQTDVDDHSTERQIWTIGGQGKSGSPPDEIDYLMVAWRAHLELSHSTVKECLNCGPGGGSETIVETISGSSSADDKLATQEMDGSHYLSPFESEGHLGIIKGSVTHTSPLGSFTIETSRPILDDLGLFMLLSETPPGSGNFNGSKVLLDNTAERPGGTRVIKCEVRWKISRKPESP